MDDELKRDELLRRAAAYERLVEALRFTTTALKRAGVAGAQYRVEQSRNLLVELGERPDD